MSDIRKKILICAYGYFPAKQYGGPPVSVKNFCESLNHYYDVYILTRDHDLKDTKKLEAISTGWNDQGICKVQYLSDREYKYPRVRDIVDELSPDMLYIQTVFAAQVVVPFLMVHHTYGIPTLLATRGELCKGAFKKKYKKIPYIYLLKGLGFFKNMFFQATSEEEHTNILRYLNDDPARVFDLSNLASIPEDVDMIYDKYPKSDAGRLKMVFVARVSPKKNLAYALECLKEISGEVVYDIYGSLEDELYWRECQRIISSLPDNISVNYKGELLHEDVHNTLAKYDAFFMPTRSENYGHSIVEAMLAGCIPIISDQTPWVDLEKDNAGYSISLDRKEYFVKAISILITKDEKQLKEMAIGCVNYIVGKLNNQSLVQNYLNSINSIIGEN